MTEIHFHFNAPHKLEHSLKVLRKGYRLGAQIVVVAPAEWVSQIDQGLWIGFEHDFIPHARLSEPADILKRSPILLATPEQDLKQSVHHEVLVSLCDDVLNGFGSFKKVIEIVSNDEHDKQRARQRWRAYADRGYAIEQLNLSAQREVA